MTLFFNADDYGWDEDANEAILELCKAQKLHGVSVMANFVHDVALERLLAHQKTVRLGLHVVLNEGRPLARIAQVSSLVNCNGEFFKSHILWVRFLLGMVKKEHILNEVVAQVNALRDAGVNLYHADSHQHIHQYPFLGSAIMVALKKAGISSVRNSMPFERRDVRRILLSIFCLMTNKHLSVFFTNQILVTALAHPKETGQYNWKRLILKLRRRKIRQAEVMCHPALRDREGCYLRRRQEFELLFKETIACA